MTSLKRSIRCSGCGNDMSFDINADLTVSDLMISGKCPRCNSTIQVNYSMVPGSVPSAPAPAQSIESPTQMVNLDESIFTPEMPSDALRDIMDD